jgi:O-antigen/teichoic acid export membrane protein
VTAPGSGGSAKSGDTIIGGALAGLSAQALTWGLGIPTSILIARAVGAQGRGEYYLPVIAGGVALVVFHLSFELASSVVVAERRLTLERASRALSAMVVIVAPLGMAAMLAAFALTRDSVFDDVSTRNYLIAVAVLPVALHAYWLGAVFVLARQIVRAQVALVAGSATYLAGAATLAALGELGVTEVLLLYGASLLVPWLLLVVWSPQVAPIRPSFDRAALRTVAAVGLPLHAGQVFLFLLLKFDVFLVAVYLGTAEVGQYSLAVLVADLAFLLAFPLVQASLPFQAALEVSESASVAFKAARFNLLVAVLIAAVFAATQWWLIPFVYGDDFSDAYDAVLALLPGVCAMAAMRPLALLLARQGRPLLFSGAHMAAFALNVGLNVVLLDPLGIVGAAVASSIAYAALAAVLIGWALRATGMRLRDAFAPQPGDGETVRRIALRLRVPGLRA